MQQQDVAVQVLLLCRLTDFPRVVVQLMAGYAQILDLYDESTSAPQPGGPQNSVANQPQDNEMRAKPPMTPAQM